MEKGLLDAKDVLLDANLKDVENQSEKSVSTRRKPGRVYWGFIVGIFFWICFKASLLEWPYHKDLQELHSHWAFGAFGRGERSQATEKVESLFV